MTAKLVNTSSDRNNNSSNSYNVQEEPQSSGGGQSPHVIIPKVIKKQVLSTTKISPVTTTSSPITTTSGVTTTTIVSKTTSTTATSTSSLPGSQHKLAAIEVNIPSSRRFSFSCEGRRANKPLMEKRRRARINQSLALLKALILDSAKSENTKHSKLEKADILELTVRHLQRQKTLGSAVLDKYRAGFQECAKEVTRFLESPELHLGVTPSLSSNKPGSPNQLIDPTIKQRLLRHLESCVSEIDLDFSLAAMKSGIKSLADSEVDNRMLDDPMDDSTIVNGSSMDCSQKVKQEPMESDETTKPDSSTISPGDENNNNHNNTNNNSSSSSCINNLKNNNHKTKRSSGARSRKSSNPEKKPIIATMKSAATTTRGMDVGTSFSSGVITQANPSTSQLSVVQVIPSRLPDGQVVFLLPSHYVQVSGQDSNDHIPEKRQCLEDNPEQDAPLDFSVRPHGDKFMPNNWVSVGTTTATTPVPATTPVGTVTASTSPMLQTRTATTTVSTVSASTMTLSKSITNTMAVISESTRHLSERDEDVWRPW